MSRAGPGPDGALDDRSRRGAREPDPDARRRTGRLAPGGWRFSPSTSSSAERRVYGAVTAVFLAVFVAFLWPVYPLLSRIRPMVAGVPLSLAWLLLLLGISFASLLALYRWEVRHGKLEGIGGDDDEDLDELLGEGRR